MNTHRDTHANTHTHTPQTPCTLHTTDTTNTTNTRRMHACTDGRTVGQAHGLIYACVTGVLGSRRDGPPKAAQNV